MTHYSKQLKGKERFSKDVPYDEAIVRLWVFTIYRMVDSLLYEDSKGRLKVRQRNFLKDVEAIAFNNAYALSIFDDHSHVAKKLKSIKGKTIQGDGLFVLKSVSYNKLFTKARLFLRQALRKCNPSNRSDIRDVAILKLMSVQPCPEWFKPTYATPVSFRSENRSFQAESTPYLHDWSHFIEKYLGIDSILFNQAMWYKEQTLKHDNRRKKMTLKAKYAWIKRNPERANGRPETVKKNRRAYYEANKAKENARSVAWKREKYHNDPEFRAKWLANQRRWRAEKRKERLNEKRISAV